MDIMQIGIIGITAAVLALSVKNQLPQFALMISIIGGILIFMMIMPKISAAMQIFYDRGDKTGIGDIQIGIILKIIGIAYIAEFASQICIDSGESAVASKVELGGKVMILITSMPVIMAMVDLVEKLLP